MLYFPQIYYLRIIFPRKLNEKIRKFTITIVAPAGMSRKKEAVIPISTEITANKTETNKAPLKPFEICKAETAGKIRRADTNMMPTTFIASTTVIAVSEVRIIFTKFVLIPVALAKVSSNVTENKS